MFLSSWLHKILAKQLIGQIIPCGYHPYVILLQDPDAENWQSL